MAEFEIEKNVPIPPRKGGKTGKYPWRELKCGDSFFVPKRKHVDPPSDMKKQGYQFTFRRMDGGVRVWRVK